MLSQASDVSVVAYLWNFELVLIEVTLIKKILKVKKLFGTDEAWGVNQLLIAETGVLCWLEQGLEPDDATVLGELSYLFHCFLSCNSFFIHLFLNNFFKNMWSIQTNAILFGQVFEIDIDKLIKHDFSCS